MTAETVCIGSELLSGRTVNSDASYLAGQYVALGIVSHYQSVVDDNENRICEALRIALSRSDLVVVTGGLGQAQDDLTRVAVARLLGRNLQQDEVILKRIREFYQNRGIDPAPESSLRQSMIPEGAVILDNDLGLSPGLMIFPREGRMLIMLPGAIQELTAIWESRVVPILKKQYLPCISSGMVKICGRTESEVAELLSDLLTREGEVSITPYTTLGEVHLRVTATAEDEKSAKKLIKPVIKEIKGRLGNSVYTTHEEKTLEAAVVELLLANGLTVTTVESCTGGMIAARLINVPGVSEIFKSGHITYSNKAKRKFVGVKRKSLDKFGAVSEQVVREMLTGASLFTHADVAVAVSGIAGPDGGSEEKPVGLVYIGVSVCGVITTEEHHFTGDRARVRESTTEYALILLRRCIMQYYSKDLFG